MAVPLQSTTLATVASIVEQFDAAGQKCAALRAVVSKAAPTELPGLMARTLLFEKGHARTHLSEVIIGLWAADAPAAAMDCAYRAEGSERSRLIGRVVRGWATSDLAGAYQWVQQLAEGPLKREAMQGITGALTAAATRNPEQALRVPVLA